MKTKFLIPRVLGQYCEGELELSVEGTTIGAALNDVAQKCPALHSCICDETGKLRRHINLFINDDLLLGRESFATRLKEGDVVSVFQAVSGG